MTKQTIGIIVNGATGRIGSTQHLANALVPIINEGGLPLGDDRLLPRLLLVGRDPDCPAAVARAHGLAHWTTDLDLALSSPDHAIFFDAAPTGERTSTLEKAMAAGADVYSEHTPAASTASALGWLERARSRGLRHGIVEAKTHLPGVQNIAGVARCGFFGRI